MFGILHGDGAMGWRINADHGHDKGFEHVMKVGTLRYKSAEVSLKVPLDVDISFDGKVYTILSDEISCIGEGRTFEETLEDFSSRFMCDMELASAYGRESNEYVDRIMYHVEGR